MRILRDIPESSRRRMVRQQLEELMKLNDSNRLDTFTYVVGIRDLGMVQVDYASYCAQGEEGRIAQVLVSIAGRLMGNAMQKMQDMLPKWFSQDPREAAGERQTRH